MFNYHIKIAWRSFIKNKSNSFINLSSLVIGFTCLILIAFWIQYELSYDTFHEKANRIYRVAYKGVLMGSEVQSATTSKPFYNALSNDFPEVETATIISNFHNALLTKKDGKSFRVKLSGITPSFFKIFSIPVISGDINKLDQPNTAVVSKEMAKKFFGNKNPIGQIVSTGMDRGNKEFTIVGVVENIAENSHFDFDMLYSNNSQSWFRNNSGENWLDANFYNYIVLKEGVDYKSFESKFNTYITKKVKEVIKRWKNISLEEWHASGDWVNFELQPITDIHLYSALESEYKQNGSILYIYIFLVVGILILVISIINFSNLSTVRAFGRSKEIGVRKVSGLKRSSLILQHLVESILLSFIAFLASLLIVYAVSPYFESITGIQIEVYGHKFLIIAALFFGVALLSGLLGGIFPALILSKLSPVKIFSSSGKIKFQGIFLKDILIVGQFVISIAVIIGTMIISSQLDYLQNKNLGFNKDNIVVIKGTVDLPREKSIVLNEMLQKLSYIKASSSSQYTPSEDVGEYLIGYKFKDKVETAILNFLPCDYNYKNVYQFDLLKGRFFDKDFNEQSRKIVLNEKAVKLLGEPDCIGKTIRRDRTDYEIIGIVKDFHFNSKHKEIEALGLIEIPDNYEFWPPKYCSAALNTTDVKGAIADIEKIWNELAPGIEFNYAFFDQEYNNLYKQEMQTKNVFFIFSIIAIALSCFGLFGFVKYSIQVRTKEIGIRKVNGARNNSIFLMLSTFFTRPILIALFISCPITWYMVNKWLQNFAYHTSINPLYFIVAGILTIAIVFLTVGWLSWSAARRNPVEALRYE